MKTSESIQKNLKIYENLKIKIQKLDDFEGFLKDLDIDIDHLRSYYEDSWLEDYDKYWKTSGYWDFFSEDGIWNLLDDFYRSKLRILKKIVEKID